MDLQAPLQLSGSLRISAHHDGAVILDTHEGQLFSANNVGARILTLLGDGGTDLDAMVARISQEFGAPAERVSVDVRRFVETLRARGLLQA